MKKIVSFIVPLIVFIIVVVLTNHVLQKKIYYLSEIKDLSEISSEYGDSIKDKGITAEKVLANNNNLFLMGSSEMAINVPQNTIKLFPIKGAEYNVSCFGRGYVQNLQQATFLGGCNVDSNQKVAYILSLQWFDNEDGVQPDKFAANFSEIQFYKFMTSGKISSKNKRYYAKRVSEILSKTDKFKAEELYCKIYLNNRFWGRIERVLMLPYYKISEYLISIKDKGLTYEELKQLKDKDETEEELEEVDWEKEDSEITQDNEQISSDNQFNLTDKYYKDNVESQLDNVKDKLKNQDMITSVEMEDFKFFISVCNELGIKPYIIIPPVNGWYYDYLGLNVDKRNEFYDYIDNICKENNMEILDLRKYEYKKGFLCDVMHLGNEGWLKVSEGIYNNFKK